MCTGEHGPSYAHCRLLEVAYKGQRSSEAVHTGDYKHNNGTGGAPVYPGIKVNDDRYSSPLIPGIVWATHDTDDGSKLSQFSITTGTCEAREFKYQRVFGLVEQGLDIVRAATEVDDITNVEIVDCGIVLPFTC
ncbi:uncharacterized protein [Palaemon carinicauda]|uniref:uncharacterized protein n=1 Tax=Palaemon carinicauda TaxID=392227 RepID=UPI0035B5AE20